MSGLYSVPMLPPVTRSPDNVREYSAVEVLAGYSVTNTRPLLNPFTVTLGKAPLDTAAMTTEHTMLMFTSRYSPGVTNTVGRAVPESAGARIPTAYAMDAQGAAVPVPHVATF